MSYVDAILDKTKDVIHVVERSRSGERIYKDYAPEYTFYYDDPRGAYKSICRTPISKFTTNSSKEFTREKKLHSGKRLWESDANPIFQCFEKHYLHQDAPNLHVAFFDIESDFCQTRGWAPISDPFNKITAISVYLSWVQTMITLVIPPPTISAETAIEISEKFSNTILCNTEAELLTAFLNVIDDADVLSGWNSDGYDIPYIVGRVLKVLSKDDLRKLCLWNQLPKKREYTRYGAEQFTYDLFGRVHLDYMDLYRRYTYEERHSYSLNAIGEYEDCGQKVDYEGSLDHLYKHDFSKFIDYNRQDVALLAKLDQKLKFIDMANAIAHSNTVLIPTTMGSVAVVDQAIQLEAHRRGMIAPDRRHEAAELPSWFESLPDDGDDSNDRAAGAYVAAPKTGIHRYIGVVDINSLYPSTIRALNMGIDTIVGQLKPTLTEHFIAKRMQDVYVGKRSYKGKSFSESWEGLFASLEYTAVMNADPGTEVTIEWEDGSPDTTCSAAEANHLILGNNRPWVLSANGTIFTFEHEGVVPSLLSRWYAERKIMQKKKTLFGGLQLGIELPESCCNANIENVPLTCDFKDIDILALPDLIASGDAQAILEYISKNNLDINGERVCAKNSAACAAAVAYWDKQQGVRKVGLNSAYGAFLNQGCRYHDHRIGQSTTLCGRTIAKHMHSFINQTITGEYVYDGDAIIYGDTDSSFFSAWPIIKDKVEAGSVEWNHDICVQLYDNIAEQINDSFPEMMENAFHCPRENGKIIRCGRESISSSGLFIKKKRYAMMIYDSEGTRLDLLNETDAKKKKVLLGIGKVKATGLDLRRSDTPVIVQKFLMDVLIDILTNKNKADIIQKIIDFKMEFAKINPWEKGTPKRVNNLTVYTAKEDKAGKAALPGHVRAAMNWNNLRKMHNDNYSMKIVDGAKTIVCKLKDNPLGYGAVGYPSDEKHLPDWFMKLPFDDALMEETVVDKKVENLLGVLKWDIRNNIQTKTTFSALFDFN